uniref:Cytochrome P450 n=1 Tax=Oryza meridionalis TaxID=40149 RepID=A0A0E0EC47_9ORYZ
MEFSLVVALIAVATSCVFVHFLARGATKKRRSPAAKKKLPPGSLGLPVIGQSLGLLRAMRSNSGERWVRRRIDRYGAVSKLSLFGKPTVLVAGAAANRFVFFSGALAMQQPRSVQRILGDKSILDLVGADHRRVRGALSEFLRPEMLRMYVGRIDGEARRHVAGCWSGRAAVTVMPLMKRLTFDIIASLLFGLGPGAAARDALAGDFERVMGGMWAVPVDLPFTAFRRSLRAAARARRLLAGITRERKAALERGAATRSSDLIACLLSLTDDRGGAPLLSEEEIVDTAMVALVAGHDTSSILMTFMVRHLANDPDTLAAMETLRMVPPIFGNFRRALEDIELDGYVIPKGWQVFWVASVTHMDAAIFHDPDKFLPSRFDSQSSSPATAKAAPPCSYVAFGGGPRICPGIEFARIETLVMMHHLVRNFRWKLSCKEDTFARDPMPTPLHGLPIEIELRISP